MTRFGDPRGQINLPSSVRTALAAAADSGGDPHVDPVDLAEYLDATLTGEARQGVEAHLAICSACRGVATAAAGLAATPDRAKTGSLVRMPSRWLAAAAVLIAILGVALFRMRGPQGSEALAALGVGPEIVAEPELVRLAVRAAEGAWPDAVALDAFGALGDTATLRAGEVTEVPVPVTPRWSAVENARPVFRWRWTGEDAPERFEVLVVDLGEKPVAFLEVALPEVGTNRARGEGGRDIRWQAAIAASEPGLERGEIYAWKINVQHAGEWLASAYVPFRVLSESESARLARDLDAAGGVAFLRAVVLASHGLDARALEALAATPVGVRERDALARGLLARSRLPDAVVEAEIEDLGGP